MRHGLVRGPASAVFVSRGLGEAGVPLRVNAPPEVCILTLAQSSDALPIRLFRRALHRVVEPNGERAALMAPAHRNTRTASSHSG